MTEIRTISLFGLGKLGIPMTACFAHKGFSVIGVDVDPRKVEMLNRGESPVYEPGTAELIRANRSRVRATHDFRSAVAESDMSSVVVLTPSDEHGGFSLKYALPAVRQIGEAIRAKGKPHLVALHSTVMPGTMDREIRPALESAAGRPCGSELGLCYNPEFIALGSVIKNFLNPDFILIGESSPEAGDRLAKIYDRALDRPAPIARMNFVNAEITKLAVNTYVTTKITFANMIRQICEKLPGANVDVVTQALGQDGRIGAKYLKGSMAYGGPCFPRDNNAIAYLARSLGVRASLAEATDLANRDEARRLADRILELAPKEARVGILGLAYKPDTDVAEEAPGVLLARELAARGVPVTAYDPAAAESARRILGDAVEMASTARECIRRSRVVVLATPWEEFKTLPAEAWSEGGGSRVILDGWRCLDGRSLGDSVRYVPLGVGPEH